MAKAPEVNHVGNPLPLADEPRWENYELLSPSGFVVEVSHNIDTGEFAYCETTRQVLTGDEQQ